MSRSLLGLLAGVAPPPKYGATAPTSDLPGWDLVFVDDFDRTALNPDPAHPRWATYNGPIPSAPNGWWLPSHVVLPGNSTLRLEAYEDAAQPGRLATGAVGLWGGFQGLDEGPDPGTGIRFEWRVRVDPDPAGTQLVKWVALTWPRTGDWPDDGEIDHAEDGGGNRQQMTATYIYGESGQSRRLPQVPLVRDMSVWNVVGAEYYPTQPGQPGTVRCLINGEVFAAWTSPAIVSGVHVPVMQTEALQLVDAAQSAAFGTRALEVDWFAAYLKMP